MSRRSRHGRSRGQSLIEVAMIMPLLILIALGGTDLAVAYGYSSDVAGAARAGMRAGIQGTDFDIGDAVRSEPKNVLAETAAVWGNEFTGNSNADCSTTDGGTMCGAANGCTSADFITDQVACFAVRTCTLDGSTGRCTSSGYGAWGSRPGSGSGQALEVVVVYRYYPKTPAITQLTGNGSAFYLTSTSTGLELY